MGDARSEVLLLYITDFKVIRWSYNFILRLKETLNNISKLLIYNLVVKGRDLLTKGLISF